MGQHWFGPPNARTSSCLEAIDEFERFETLFKLVLTASGWDDLLAEK
jgi:hypothetical protein